MAARNETIDYSNAGESRNESGKSGSYLGMAIAGILLVAMLFLQSTAGASF